VTTQAWFCTASRFAPRVGADPTLPLWRKSAPSALDGCLRGIGHFHIPRTGLDHETRIQVISGERNSPGSEYQGLQLLHAGLEGVELEGPVEVGGRKVSQSGNIRRSDSI